MRTKIIFILLASLLFTSVSVAWNSAGHRIVAQIAYDRLTPKAKASVDAITAILFHSNNADKRFLSASSWPDQIKTATTRYSSWHFIDLPINEGGAPIPPLKKKYNVVWAIGLSEKMLKNPSTNIYQRAKYLSFLIHFIGDIHQPLHCTTLYSPQFPHGDMGGNLYPIQTPIAQFLHPYWDDGLGLLYSPPNHYLFGLSTVEKMATQWTQLYSRQYFEKQLQEQLAMQWAEDSHAYAVSFVYSIPMNTKPTQAYIQEGQTIVRKQIVLAGYRLADALNQLYGQ